MRERGRPAYEPTETDRRIAEALTGWGIPHERISMVIGIDAKTLRKHFAAELEVGSARLEAQLAQNLLRIAQGNDRQSLIATIFALKSRFGWVEASPAPRDAPLGKKDQRLLNAETTASDRGSIYAPRLPPLAHRNVQ